MSEILSADRVPPMFVNDTETGKRYELDFSRESVIFAENRGFRIDEVAPYPMTRIPDLFFYAFRKNHKNVARNQTDALLEKMGGLTPAALERLNMLYQQAFNYSGVIQTDSDKEKNATATVEL